MSTINTKLLTTFVLMGGALVAQAEETATTQQDAYVKAEIFKTYNSGRIDSHADDPATTKLEMTRITDENLGLLTGEQQSYPYTCPNVNLQDGGSWTLNYTLRNKPESGVVVDIKSVTLSMYGQEEVYDGKWQATTKLATAGITLTFSKVTGGTTEVISSLTNDVKIYASGADNGTTDGTLSALLANGGFSLNPGEEVVVSLTCTGKYDGESQKGLYIGFKGIDYNGYYVQTTSNVPEPTSATLSLLALAGLAARRRRK